MKTSLVLSLLILLPFLGVSQINSSIDFLAGLDYSYRNLSTSSDDALVLGILENREVGESGKINWRFGVNYNRNLTSKLFFKTGLRLASVGFAGEKKTDLRWGSELIGGGFELDPDLPREVQNINDYWFLEIPIGIRYEICQKKLTPFIELGVSPSIYLTTRVATKTDIGDSSTFDKNNQDSFNQFHLVGFISMGLNYNLKETIQIFGQPIFRYHLTELVDAPIEEHLYVAGIEIGVRKKIN